LIRERKNVSCYVFVNNFFRVQKHLSIFSNYGQIIISLQAGKFIQLASSFLGGFVVAFIKGWKLSLAVLAVVPLVVMSTALMFIIIAKLAAQGQTAYSEATTTVEQTVGSIRTVSYFPYLYKQGVLELSFKEIFFLSLLSFFRVILFQYDKSLLHRLHLLPERHQL